MFVREWTGRSCSSYLLSRHQSHSRHIYHTKNIKFYVASPRTNVVKIQLLLLLLPPVDGLIFQCAHIHLFDSLNYLTFLSVLFRTSYWCRWKSNKFSLSRSFRCYRYVSRPKWFNADLTSRVRVLHVIHLQYVAVDGNFQLDVTAASIFLAFSWVVDKNYCPKIHQ